MWNILYQALILAQTEQEKRMTYFGVLFFGFFLFVLFLDTMAKGKFIPKKGPMKKILVFILVIVAIVAILLHFFYK